MMDARRTRKDRISEYALIGDCETAALVRFDGSILWLCWPRFDSEACFAALLGDEHNGCWRLSCRDEAVRLKRRYLGDSLILETSIEGPSGAARVIDFMPVRGEASDIVRIVIGDHGTVSTHQRTQTTVRFRAAQTPLEPGRRWCGGSDLRTPWCSADRRSRRLLPQRGRLHRRIHCIGRRAKNLRAQLLCFARRPAGRARRLDGARRDAPFLVRMVGSLHVSGALARRGDQIADRHEGADLSAERRRRRRADELAAGNARRRSQLGLPVLLAARRHLHPPGFSSGRLRSTRPSLGGTGFGEPLAAIQRASSRCTDWEARRASPSGKPTGWPVLQGRGRCALATSPSDSVSSTSMAR